MIIKIDINKMSTEGREAYLVDLIADLSYSLSRYLKNTDLDGYQFDSDLVKYANLAVNQYKGKQNA